jgi:hydrogenase nickel incorporation protein HypA/HybF
MHELSLALSILDIVSQEVRIRFGDAREVHSGQESALADASDFSGALKSVTVRIGRLSGVEPEALEFAWDVAREQSPFPLADLLVEVVPVQARCEACGCEFGITSGSGECGTCGSAPFKIVAGREIEVARIVWLQKEGAEKP